MTKNNMIQLAATSLLDAAGISERQLEAALGSAMSRGIDYADIYLQSTREESWSLEDSIVKSGNFSIDQGFGLRVISGEKTGFAYADDIAIKALEQAASSARSIVHSGGTQAIQVVSSGSVPQLYPDLNPLESMTEEDKIHLLHQVDIAARQQDPRVKQVFVSLSGEYDIVMILNSEGQLAADIRPLVHLSVSVIVEQKGQREKGRAGGGARAGYQMFVNDDLAISYAHKAVAQALRNLEAKPAPAGTMPVVLGPGWPGVLLHEAVGHGLEGDFIRKGSSAFAGRLGERVASELCTIVDDGTVPGRRGSLSVDDEGVPAQNTVLIEKGKLVNFMQDRHNAQLMGVTSTGNGRRESYACLPMPRMTNTYMLPGESLPEEIIASVEKGIYAVDFAGGQVDITSGKFVFSTSEAYWIENGKVQYPIKGATLVGNGPDVLMHVSMVGNDLALDSGQGVCGKAGQTVAVGVGQPTLKIDQLTVGGVSDSHTK